MAIIQNESLQVEINEKGAELKSIYHKDTKLEYLWNADPAYWAKSSPVLFPIVGTLKSDTLYFEGLPYKMGRHGFARDREFSVEDQSGNAVIFLLVSDDDTRKKFPFDFEFRIRYSLAGDNLSVTYEVKNTGASEMWFSVGAHPAFKVPLEPGDAYNDYFLEFEKAETAGRWQISPDGLIEDHSTPLLENTTRLPLEHKLFYQDAIVLKGLRSSFVSLKNTNTRHGFRFGFPGFPFLGIWAAKDADFVCIEPWCGIADGVNSSQQLVEKEGIQRLNAGVVFERTWTASFF